MDEPSASKPALPGDEKFLKEDAIYFQGEVLKGRSKVPPPTPIYSNTYHRSFRNVAGVDVTVLGDVPRVSDKGIKFCIENLGQKLGCDYYEYDLIQFWLLDILTDCLWKAQEIFEFAPQEQLVILNWVTEVFKVIAARKTFLKLFKEVLFRVYRLINKTCDFPDAGIIWQCLDEWNAKVENKAEEEEGEEEETGTESRSDICPSHSTFTIKSNEKLKIHPEFDIRDHIRRLKENNPLGNLYHSYSDVYTETPLSSLSHAEEELFKSEDSVSLSDASFYKPDYSTPPRFRPSYVGLNVSCTCIGCTQQTETINEDEVGSVKRITKKADTPMPAPTNKSESMNVLDYLTSDNNSQFSSPASPHSQTSLVDSIEPVVSETDTEKQREEEIMREWAYFKLIEQRGWDMDDPQVGWVPWMSFLEEQKESGSSVDDLVEAFPGEEEESSVLSEDCDEARSLNFNILKAIVDFVFEYFYENFHFTLIKLAFRATPNIITQKLNEKWPIPKVLKQEIKRPKPTPVKKEKKEKPSKEKKSKGKEKGKPPKKDKKKEKADKAPKKGKEGKQELTKEEKAELERLKQQALLEEEAQRIKDENRVFMFPLADAASEELFMSIFENWVKGATGKPGKGKKK